MNEGQAFAAHPSERRDDLRKVRNTDAWPGGTVQHAIGGNLFLKDVLP